MKVNRLKWSLVGACMAASAAVPAAPGPRLEVVAEWNRLHYDLGDAAAEQAYESQQLYRKVLLHGVKVDSKGTMYVSTARWGGPEVPATLSRLVRRDDEGRRGTAAAGRGGREGREGRDGIDDAKGWVLQPFPSLAYNDIQNAKGLKAVLGFEIDRNDVMWILDQGHVAGAPSGPGDEKLIAWDLKTGREVLRYEFTEADTDRTCSFLNDVAVDNDAGVVYITDSGINCSPLKGGLIVFDIKTRRAKRVLSAPECVNDEPGFRFQIHGRDVLKPKDGQPNPMKTGADGIALSGDKRTLYWTNLTGNRLLSLPTALIRDFDQPESAIQQAVRVVSALPSNTDGMTSDRQGNLYMTGLMLNGLMRRDARTGEITTFVSDNEISWPDTVAWGPKGALFFVSNHLHLWVDGDMDFDRPEVPNFRIYRVQTGAKPYHAR